MVNEFLTNLSSAQPVLWGLFVLGVIGAASLVLSLFWARAVPARLLGREAEAESPGGLSECTSPTPTLPFTRRCWCSSA